MYVLRAHINWIILLHVKIGQLLVIDKSDI